MDQSTRPTNLPLFDIICKTTTDLPIMILIALATLVLAVCSVVTPVKAAGSTCTPTTPQDSANTARKLPSFLAFPPYDSQQYSRQASESSDPLLCSTIYGGGADWFVGYYGQDQVELGGAKGSGQQVCLYQIAGTDIDVALVEGVSPQLGDGIMGLNPACTVLSESCPGSEVDVISALVRSGAISSYVFTMCSKGDGGKLSLGPPGTYPSPISWYPLLPFYSNTGIEAHSNVVGYFLRGPSDRGNVEWALSDKNGTEKSIYCMTSDFLENKNTSYIMIDSGAGGAALFPDLKDPIFESVAKAWFSNDEARKVLTRKLSTLDSAVEVVELLAQLSDGTIVETLPLTDEEANLLLGLVPDLKLKGLDGGDLILSGDTFLYETTPCSGNYRLSWTYTRQLAGGGNILIGGALIHDKTTVFDVSDPFNPRLGVMTEQGDCADYSENGHVVDVTLTGGKSNALNPDVGVFTADVSFGGGGPFTVLLDTGSGYFSLYTSKCRQLNGKCLLVKQDTRVDTSRLIARVFNSTEQASKGFDPQDCSAYSVIEENYNNVTDAGYPQGLGGIPALILKGSELLNFLAANIQPQSFCEPLREECGLLNEFSIADSTTFKYIPEGSKVDLQPYTQQPPPFSMNGKTCALDACSKAPSTSTTGSPTKTPTTSYALPFMNQGAASSFIITVAVIGLFW